MLLFDFLKDINYRKTGDLLNSLEAEQEFNPFMIQRFLSMNKKLTVLLNDTTNRLYNVLNEKKDWYKLLLVLVPQNKNKSKYIKKIKKEKEIDNDKVIEFIAKNNEISKKEVELYIKTFNIDISLYKKGLKDV